MGVAAPKPFVQTPDMVRLLSLRNSRGFHDHILCAQVGKSSKWVAHPGTYKTRKSGRRVYHFGDLEVLDTEELAWEPTQAKKRLKLGIDEEEPDCCRLPADLDAYNDAKGEHHGLLATFAVARLIAAQQTEAGQADESQALSLLNFDVGTWPTTAHLHRTLLVWSDSKGVLKARSTRKLQGAIHFTTPPSGTSMPPTRPAGVRKFGQKKRYGHSRLVRQMQRPNLFASSAAYARRSCSLVKSLADTLRTRRVPTPQASNSAMGAR